MNENESKKKVKTIKKKVETKKKAKIREKL